MHLVGFIIRITVNKHGWSHDHHHQKVWEGARLTTRRFDGVQRLLMFENISQDHCPSSTPMTNPRTECHSEFIGGYWYLQEHYNITIRKASLGILHCHSV